MALPEPEPEPEPVAEPEPPAPARTPRKSQAAASAASGPGAGAHGAAAARARARARRRARTRARTRADHRARTRADRRARTRADRPSPNPRRPPSPSPRRPRARRRAEPSPVAAVAPAPARRRRLAPERPLPVKRTRSPLGYSPAAPERPLPPRRRPQPPPQQDEPLLPGRRFARAEPWPEAESEWSCEIDWKAGYRKSAFRAMAAPPGAGRRRPIAESPPIRWTLMAEPEPPTPEMVKAVKAIVTALEAAGWERTGGAGGAWYALRFLWRGSGEPQRIDIQGRDSANA